MLELGELVYIPLGISFFLEKCLSFQTYRENSTLNKNRMNELQATGNFHLNAFWWESFWMSHIVLWSYFSPHLCLKKTRLIRFLFLVAKQAGYIYTAYVVLPDFYFAEQ